MLNRTIPFNILKKVDLLRRRRIYHKHKAIFIHIPKAAGSSISFSIYGKRLGHHYARDLKLDMSSEFDRLFKFRICLFVFRFSFVISNFGIFNDGFPFFRC